jgi:FkbM family methyltransferase
MIALFKRMASQLPFDTALAMARELLLLQGFGSGGAIANSGELAVFDLLAGNDRPTLFDIGGHLGEYTGAFIRRFPHGRSFVFEPSAAHTGLLRERLAAQSNATVMQMALAAAGGEATLYKDDVITGLASLIPRRLDHFGIRMNLEESVTVSTVDEVRAAQAVEFIDLMKIDVEGGELDVLRGGRQTFADGAVGMVQFEFGGCNLDSRTNLKDFYQFFGEYGFTLHIVQPSGRIHPLGRYDEMYEQFRTTNYVALPAGG